MNMNNFERHNPSQNSTPIDRQSPIPFYIQLKENIREKIEKGEWRPGDQIPGEAELGEMFDISRTVIRQALQELTYEGLINREKGRGTFVAKPKINESLVQSLTGFHQDMANRGMAPRSQVLKQVLVPATAKIAGFLKLDPGTPVIEVQRLRFIANEPIVLVTTYLPYALCPKLIHADLTSQSLYDFIENECGILISRGRRTIEAVLASENEAQMLKVDKGAPLILLNSISYLADGTPIEYYHAVHRGDRSRFEVELVRLRDRGKSLESLDLNEEDLPASNATVI
jgi:GntR family transcriptional regulator